MGLTSSPWEGQTAEILCLVALVSRKCRLLRFSVWLRWCLGGPLPLLEGPGTFQIFSGLGVECEAWDKSMLHRLLHLAETGESSMELRARSVYLLSQSVPQFVAIFKIDHLGELLRVQFAQNVEHVFNKCPIALPSAAKIDGP